MADFYLKKNDTSPFIRIQCQDDGGNPVDLSGATAKFLMREVDSDTTKVDSAATITDAANGKVQYEWSSSDTDTAGDFEAEFEITYGDSTVETFPNADSYIEVKISDDIG